MVENADQSKERKRVVTVRMSPMLHSRLASFAKSANRSINTVCTAAIEEYVLERTADDDPTEVFDGGVDRPSGVCQKCGCTEEDCSNCIKQTGGPCHWANKERTLCSACVVSEPN